MGKLRTVRDRLFAWMGVIVILISAGALSAFVIAQAVTSDNSSTANNAAAQAPTCSLNGSVASEQLAAPDAYKTTDAVTSLQVTDLHDGSGAAAKGGDCLVMKYYGTLAADGTLFDEDFTKPTALQFPLGQGQVIPGWDQGIVGMKVGGVRRLVIPSSLAYGANGSCKVQNTSDPSKCDQYVIPPNTPLVFVVKLESIKQ